MSNKVKMEFEVEDLLGLKDNNKTLTYDLSFIADKGINSYVRQEQKNEKKKQEFIEMFKECFDEIIKIIDNDPKQRIIVNCWGCKTWGKDLSHHYHIQSKNNKRNKF